MTFLSAIKVPIIFSLIKQVPSSSPNIFPLQMLLNLFIFVHKNNLMAVIMDSTYKNTKIYVFFPNIHPTVQEEVIINILQHFFNICLVTADIIAWIKSCNEVIFKGHLWGLLCNNYLLKSQVSVHLFSKFLP